MTNIFKLMTIKTFNQLIQDIVNAPIKFSREIKKKNS